MIASTDAFAAGIPVEIGEIDRELAKLWEQGGEMMARASLVNLAIYSEAPEALARNTKIIAEVAEDHACRAIVIAAAPKANEDRVEAWISAHCHVSRAGSKHVCSEQLSFLLLGTFAGLLPNIVFSHLDSDLPFYFWWQGEFCDPMDPQLWSWVDRLIYDSRLWRDADAQWRLLDQAREEANTRVVLCDLNWTRLIHVRLALAHFFDSPAAQRALASIARVEIDFAPGHRSTALLLIGWLATQLRWRLLPGGDSLAPRFAPPSGPEVEIALKEVAGESLSRCSVSCDATEFRIEHRADADLLQASTHVGGKERTQELMPACANEPVQLLREELMRGGPHRIYLRAIESVRPLL